MENSGDKFASLIIPNCLRTASQDEKLQSCLFARESNLSPDDIIPSSSSTEEAPEQATGIEMLTLPDSCDEYQTPPEQPYSQNSSNDGVVAATKIAAFVRVDDDGEYSQGKRVVDLAIESDNLDTEKVDVDDRVDEMVSECFETEVIGSPEESAHQVFVEMPQREDDTSNIKKRKLPFLMETHKQKSNYRKHEAFKDSLNRVLKMVGEGRSRGCGEEDNDNDDDDDVDINFLETAKMRGLTLPRPRWWPVKGFIDYMSFIKKW